MTMKSIEAFSLAIASEGNDVECIVDKDKFIEFVCFLKGKADYFSLECYYDGKVNRKQFKSLKEEYKRYVERECGTYESIEKSYKERLENVLGIKTKKEIKQYFKELKRDYRRNILNEAKRQSGYCKQINLEKLSEKGLIEYKLTCNTPSTMGNTRNIYYFPVRCLNDIIGEMKNLYDYINFDGFQFENLTFYKADYDNEDNAFYITTTHEKDAILSVTNEEFRKLVDSKILIMYPSKEMGV